jgi:hypothetical protein
MRHLQGPLLLSIHAGPLCLFGTEAGVHSQLSKDCAKLAPLTKNNAYRAYLRAREWGGKLPNLLNRLPCGGSFGMVRAIFAAKQGIAAG